MKGNDKVNDIDIEIEILNEIEMDGWGWIMWALHDTDSTVGRCNLSICAIDRLIVQVPRILKEPGTFSLSIVLPFQGRFHYLKCSLLCFQIWDWAQCQSRLFSSVELIWNWLRDLSDMWEVEVMNLSWFRRRDLNDEWKTWHVYIYIIGFKMWYPLDALATAHLTVIVS